MLNLMGNLPAINALVKIPKEKTRHIDLEVV